MPLGSLIIVGVILYLLCRKRDSILRFLDLFILASVVKLYWFQGYFLKIQLHEVSSLEKITLYVLILYSVYLLVLGKISFGRNTVKYFLIFVFVSLLSAAYEIVIPYNGLLMPFIDNETNWDKYSLGLASMQYYIPPISSFIEPYFRLYSVVFLILIFKQILTPKLFIYCYMEVIKWLKWGIYYGCFEFVLKNVLDQLTFTYFISDLFFGVNSSSVITEAIKKGDEFYSLQGFTREPSHYNCFIFDTAMLMILGNTLYVRAKQCKIYIKKTYDNFTIACSIFLLLITGGFSSVWYVFLIIVLSLIIYVHYRNVSLLKYILRYKFSFFLGMIVFVIVSAFIFNNDYLYNRLLDSFFVVDMLLDSSGVFALDLSLYSEGVASTLARFVSVYEGINIFLARPLLGISYNLQWILDYTFMYLANLGIVGTVSLFLFLSSNNEKLKTDALLLFMLYIVGGIPLFIMADDFGIYWALYFEATIYYKNYKYFQQKELVAQY